MLSDLFTVWQHVCAFLANPALDTSCLLVIILAEIHAIYHDRIQTQEAKKQTALAADTYSLYRNYFETTEKRKADWREAQRKSRALKKERAQAAPELEVEAPPEEPVPPPTNGKVPPLALPEEDEETEVPSA